MVILLVIFGLSAFLIIFNYGLYAIIARFCTPADRRRPHMPEAPLEKLPSLSLIVASYNESYIIEEKIANTLALTYPSDRLEIIFVTDGSYDDSPQRIAKYPSIRLLHDPVRSGKSAAMNRAVKQASNEILIFCDANTILNKEALLLVARHYLDPQCGGVAGEKRVYNPEGENHNVGSSEGLYWKYESALKKIDSDFETVVGAAGELFSLRKSLFEDLGKDIILDDFVLSLKVAQKGYRFIYEPEAFAMELPSMTLEDEKKRKIRISAGGFQAIFKLRGLFKFWKHPKLSYLYISHRVLRWAITPFCLPIAFASNLGLVLYNPHLVFQVLLIAQILFYTLGLAGSFMKNAGLLGKISRTINYFLFMNLAVYWGLMRFLRGNQKANWDKAKRMGEPV